MSAGLSPPRPRRSDDSRRRAGARPITALVAERRFPSAGRRPPDHRVGGGATIPVGGQAPARSPRSWGRRRRTPAGRGARGGGRAAAPPRLAGPGAPGWSGLRDWRGQELRGRAPSRLAGPGVPGSSGPRDGRGQESRGGAGFATAGGQELRGREAAGATKAGPPASGISGARRRAPPPGPARPAERAGPGCVRGRGPRWGRRS